MPDIYIPGGYILLSRRLIESEIWDKPPLYLKVWIYILTRARHKAEGNYKRGELLLTIPEIQEACSHKVGFRKETPSKKQIFTILEWLRNPHDGVRGGNDDFHTTETMIGTQKTTRGLIVKVHNYNVYQDSDNYKKTHDGNAEGNDKGTTAGARRERQGNTIHKNEKNVMHSNNEKNDKTNDSREIISFYENNGYGTINGTESERVVSWLEEGFTKDAVIRAYKIGAETNNRGKGYIDGIFRNWRNAKTYTVNDIDDNDQKRQSQRRNGKTKPYNADNAEMPEHNRKLMEERAAQREADIHSDDLPF